MNVGEMRVEKDGLGLGGGGGGRIGDEDREFDWINPTIWGLVEILDREKKSC